MAKKKQTSVSHNQLWVWFPVPPAVTKELRSRFGKDHSGGNELQTKAVLEALGIKTPIKPCPNCNGEGITADSGLSARCTTCHGSGVRAG